jgi:bisphosphoglycerate-independent phosphoglycerate mutase (AlkP superfamily)
MDRNSDFEKTDKIVNLLFENNNQLTVDEYFDKEKNNSDEFFEPISFLNETNYLKNNDTCFFTNYRNDRI